MPAAPKKPQDHKAKSPIRAENAGSDIVIDFEGTTYTITRELIDNLEIFELVEDGKAITATRAFLGPEQWQTLKGQLSRYDDDGRKVGPPQLSRLNDFLNVLMGAIGGNSSASAAS